MIKFKTIGGPYGDATSSYDVTLDKQYTIKEFIQMILSENPKEFGYFFAVDSNYGAWTCSPRLEYRYGKIVGNNIEEFLSKFSDKVILDVSAHGGWSAMDYRLYY